MKRTAFDRAVRRNLRRHVPTSRRRDVYDSARVAEQLDGAWSRPDAGGCSAPWLDLEQAEDPGGAPGRRPVALDAAVERLRQRQLRVDLGGRLPVFLRRACPGGQAQRDDQPARRQHVKLDALRTRGQHVPGGRIDALRRLVGPVVAG